MNYYMALTLCFILWSVYAIPGNMAEKVHGVQVNMLFETLAFIGVTIFLAGKIIPALPKVTMMSAFQGSLMGIGSAVGFYFFIMALSLAPGAKGIAFILLVAGLTFPAQGAIFALMGESLRSEQWLAIVGMIGCILLYKWKDLDLGFLKAVL